MKRLVAATFILVGITIPSVGQRASSHGSGHVSGHGSGVSGHSFHSVSRAQAQRGLIAARPAGQSRSISMPRGRQVRRASTYQHRLPYRGLHRYRAPYVPLYGSAIGFGLPYFIAYPNDFDDDNRQEMPVAAVAENDAQAGGQGLPESDLAQSSPAVIEAPAEQTEERREAVTIIFKDGRPPEQIYNYILTRDTLYVGGQHQPDIPVEQLDLTATAKVNHDVGVDFRLPGAPR